MSYHYVGTDLNLEQSVVEDMNLEKESITRDECFKEMGIKKDEAGNVFPRADKGVFFKSTFDGIQCLVYELKLTDNRSMQFIWLRMD